MKSPQCLSSDISLCCHSKPVITNAPAAGGRLPPPLCSAWQGLIHFLFSRGQTGNRKHASWFSQEVYFSYDWGSGNATQYLEGVYVPGTYTAVIKASWKERFKSAAAWLAVRTWCTVWKATFTYNSCVHTRIKNVNSPSRKDISCSKNAHQS